jgi:hypothetical protein
MSSTATEPTCEISEILVRIPMADGSVGEGLMVSFEGGLITALFNAESEPAMAVGREGIMSIVGGDKAAQVRYRIVKREDAGNEITYTFQSDITHGGRWGIVKQSAERFPSRPGQPCLHLYCERCVHGTRAAS